MIRLISIFRRNTGVERTKCVRMGPTGSALLCYTLCDLSSRCYCFNFRSEIVFSRQPNDFRAAAANYQVQITFKKASRSYAQCTLHMISCILIRKMNLKQSEVETLRLIFRTVRE